MELNEESNLICRVMSEHNTLQQWHFCWLEITASSSRSKIYTELLNSNLILIWSWTHSNIHDLLWKKERLPLQIQKMKVAYNWIHWVLPWPGGGCFSPASTRVTALSDISLSIMVDAASICHIQRSLPWPKHHFHCIIPICSSVVNSLLRLQDVYPWVLWIWCLTAWKRIFM